jgi:hypothetical protein
VAAGTSPVPIVIIDPSSVPTITERSSNHPDSLVINLDSVFRKKKRKMKVHKSVPALFFPLNLSLSLSFSLTALTDLHMCPLWRGVCVGIRREEKRAEHSRSGKGNNLPAAGILLLIGRWSCAEMGRFAP